MGETFNDDEQNAQWRASESGPVVPDVAQIAEAQQAAASQRENDPYKQRQQELLVGDIRDKADQIQQFMDGVAPNSSNSGQLAELKQSRQNIVDSQTQSMPREIIAQSWSRAEEIMRQLGK